MLLPPRSALEPVPPELTLEASTQARRPPTHRDRSFVPAAALFLIVNITIFVYLISNYAEDFEQTPRRLLLALDHSIFVGVLTMAIMGYVANLSPTARPAWVDHAVFGGIVAGAGLFVAGLLADMDPLIHAGTPLLGAALLLGIGVHVLSLLSQWSASRA